MNEYLYNLCKEMMDLYKNNNLLGFSNPYRGINSIKEDDKYYYISFEPNDTASTPMFVHKFDKTTNTREDLDSRQAGFSYDMAKSIPVPKEFTSEFSYDNFLKKVGSQTSFDNTNSYTQNNTSEKDIYINENIKRAQEAMENKNYTTAKFNYTRITEKYPEDYRGWLFLLKYYSKEFTAPLYLEVPNYQPVWLVGLSGKVEYLFHKVEMYLTDEDALNTIRSQYSAYMDRNKNKYDDLNKNFESQSIPVISNGNDGLVDETINTGNKIIKAEELKEIFELLHNELIKYQAIYNVEKNYNSDKEDDSEYSFKDFGSNFTASINFTDSTCTRFDDYSDFINIFENRVREIDSVRFRLELSYSVKYDTLEKRVNDVYGQSITVNAEPKNLEFNVNISSKDDKLNKEYNRIKQIVLNAPDKYTKIIKNRYTLSILFCVAYGMIPAIILSFFLVKNEGLMEVFKTTYITYPIIVFLISFVIGRIIYVILVKGLYKNIVPNREYVKYDSKRGEAVYKDEVDKYTSCSEVLIGKYTDNLICRNKIEKYIATSKKILPFELLALAISSIIILFI